MGQTCSYNLYGSSMFESVNTFVAGANITIIPERLSVKLLYTYVYGKDSWTTGPFDLACTGTNCFNGVNAVNGINIVGLPSPGSPAFPDYNNIANRFDGSVNMSSIRRSRHCAAGSGKPSSGCVISTRATRSRIGRTISCRRTCTLRPIRAPPV